jgi:hypothetical protein
VLVKNKRSLVINTLTDLLCIKASGRNKRPINKN